MKGPEMAATYIPWWAVWLGLEEGDALRQAVRELLANLPLSQQELAAEIAVDPSTVSRWAAGRTVPSVSELRAVYKVLESRLARLRAQVEWGGQLLDALDAVGQSRKVGFKARQAAREKVHELLVDSKSKRTRPRSRKRKRTSRH